MVKIEYINDINIIEAVIHILDTENKEPILNNFQLELTQEVYTFLYKHIDKCLNSENLRYAVFKDEKRVVKEISQKYLNGQVNIMDVSQEFAKQLFYIMRANSSIPSCDVLTVSISTDIGNMIGIIKLDYTKSFTHRIELKDEKFGIDIIEHKIGLPTSGQKIEKCAFIRLIKENQQADLMVIDKQKRTSEGEDFGGEYFVKHYLGCELVYNEKDMTKSFVKSTEDFIRKNIAEDPKKGMEIRSFIKTKLTDEEVINVNEVSREIFKECPDMQSDFIGHITKDGIIEDDIVVDKIFATKKMQKVKLNADGDIDLNISIEAFKDKDKFEVIENIDGTVNINIKNIKNLIEK